MRQSPSRRASAESAIPAPVNPMPTATSRPALTNDIVDVASAWNSSAGNRMK